MFGDATNKQLRTLQLISIMISVLAIGIALFAHQTVQVQADSTGKIFTGTIRTHLKRSGSNDQEKKS